MKATRHKSSVPMKGKPRRKREPVKPQDPPVDFARDPDERLVTPADVRVWLNVSERYVFSLMVQKPPVGLPPAMKFGKFKRWQLGQLRSWMKRRAQTAMHQQH
jgi:hypothetical protein